MAEAKKKVVTIVGGGSSAHVLIPFLSGAGLEVNILTRRPGEWSKEIELQLHSIHSEVLETFNGYLTEISDDPAQVIPQADYIIICMPVCKYRMALHHLAPHVNRREGVFIGTIYGQAGFNWMVDEIKKEFRLDKVATFAVGLIPWVCRFIEYGKVGVTYGCKAVNVVAVSPPERFEDLNEELLKNICERWLNKGAFEQSENFLSLTLSVDNQIIHPSRCYQLFLNHGGKWATKEDIPYLGYQGGHPLLLQGLRRALCRPIARPGRRLLQGPRSNQGQVPREGLQVHAGLPGARAPLLPIGELGHPRVLRHLGHVGSHQAAYGLCITKWMADQLGLTVPTIDRIIDWVQVLRNEKLIEGDKLLLDSEDITTKFKSGIPPVYGMQTIDDVVD